MDVMKICDAIQGYIIAYQSPGYRTRLAMMQRLKGIGKMRNVARAGVDCQVEDFGLRLRVANKYSHAPSCKLSNEIETARYLRRKRHQTREAGRPGGIIRGREQVYRSGLAIVRSEVLATQSPTTVLADERPFEMNPEDASAWWFVLF